MANALIPVSPTDNYDHDPHIKRHDFPPDFMFGVATSAFQVEGAWNEDGKGLNMWDCFTLRHPDKIADGSNACVAIDSYHRIKEDVQLLKKMGVNYYRFSISWSRILPGGKVSMGKNPEGINYYNRLIDELKANHIEPFVTLFHWDLPNALEEEYMGFLSSKIVDDFVNYAELCFWEFGDRVKNWITLNEPYQFTSSGYVNATYPPGRGGSSQEGDPETEPYMVAYNLLKCHAATYRKYEEDFKDAQKGKVGITLDTNFFKPFRGKDNEGDVKAVEYAYDFMLGLFLEPLTSGTWPKNVQKFATTPSPHHPQGRYLPVFTEDEKKKLVRSYDFLGINYYTSYFARYIDESSVPPPAPGFLTDCHFAISGMDIHGTYIGEAAFDGSYIFLCALELVDLLEHIQITYKVKTHIIITENGTPEKNDDQKTYEQVRDDAFRLKYLKWHLEAIRRVNSVRRLGSQGTKPLVMGYFAWSFVDNFEWSFGYTLRYGMNYVDFKNNLQRYPKKSAIWYKKFLSGNKLYEPRKRSITDVDQEDDIVNDAPLKETNAIDVVQKLKKAKAT